jgi:hypothetical protein
MVLAAIGELCLRAFLLCREFGYALTYQKLDRKWTNCRMFPHIKSCLIAKMKGRRINLRPSTKPMKQ